MDYSVTWNVSEDVSENPLPYIKLWRNAKKHLSMYAQVEAKHVYNNTPRKVVFTNPVSSHSDAKHPPTTNAETPSEEDDTCTERMIRVISSQEKADQMKARRESSVVIVRNPILG